MYLNIYIITYIRAEYKTVLWTVLLINVPGFLFYYFIGEVIYLYLLIYFCNIINNIKNNYSYFLVFL